MTLTRLFQLTAQLRDRFPEDPAGFKIGASILRGQNRLAHAEALLADAAKRFPEEEWPGAMAAEATRLRIHRAATVARYRCASWRLRHARG